MNGVSAFQRTIDKIVEDEGLSQTFPYVDNVTVCGTDQADHDAQVGKWLAASTISLSITRRVFYQLVQSLY